MKDILITLFSISEFKDFLQDTLREVIREELADPNQIPHSPVTPERFCNELGYMSLSKFYQNASRGNIPGAFKVGARWFIDLEEFESVSKKIK